MAVSSGRAEPEPVIDLDRPRSGGQLVDAAFALYRRAPVLFVPGVMLLVRWAVATQVAAAEDGMTPRRAIGRRSELTEGRRQWVFGFLLLLWLAVGAVGVPVGLALGNDATVLAVAVGAVVATLAASVSALVTALLYFTLRAHEAGTSPGARAAPGEHRPAPLGYDGPPA